MKSRLRNLYENLGDLIHPKKTLYFLHIPKSGGTSLVHFLRNNFQSHHWLNDGCFSLEHFFNLPREEFIQNHCFRGHFGMIFFNRFERPLNHFITILRDPIEQFCSNTHFQKKRFDQGFLAPWRPKEIFEAPDYFNRFIEHKTSRKMLSPILYNVGMNISQEVLTMEDYYKEVESFQEKVDYDMLVHEAKSNFTKMTTIMFLEDIEASTIRLCDDLGIKPPASFPKLNKGILRAQNNWTYKDRLDKAQLEQIEEYLKYDIKLYHFAHDLVYGHQQNL